MLRRGVHTCDRSAAMCPIFDDDGSILVSSGDASWLADMTPRSRSADSKSAVRNCSMT
jgi:hypothetical protein